jgi:hypothetical protein
MVYDRPRAQTISRSEAVTMIDRESTTKRHKRSGLTAAVLGIVLSLLLSSCSLFKGKGESEPVTVGPEGGTFTLDNGISLRVPAGVLGEETELQMNRIENDSIASILEEAQIPLRPIIFFEALPDGLQLDEAIEVTVPIPEDVVLEGWPVHLELDMENETFSYSSTGLRFNPEERKIIFILDHFSPHGAGEIPGGGIPNECDDPAMACRCGWVHLESKPHRYESDNCSGMTQLTTGQFMDCPDQPITRVEEVNISDGCIWQGSLAFHVLIVMEGQEIHMTCADPIPFKVEEDEISGSGTMHCTINDSIEMNDPDVGTITLTFDSVMDFTLSLSGNLDGFQLEFDPLSIESIVGHFKIDGAVPEVGSFAVVDIDFDGSTASGDFGIMDGFTLFSFSTSIGEDESEGVPAMTFPLFDGETFEIPQQEEGVSSVTTITLHLTVGKE